MKSELNHKVISLIESGQYNEAVTLLLKELSFNPKDFDVLYNLGYSYRWLEDYENSIKYYKEAALVDPKQDTAYLGLGVVYQLLEDYNEALKYLDKAATINPNNVQTINSTALTYKKMGNYEVALAAYMMSVQKLFENICLKLYGNEPQSIIGFKPTKSDKWMNSAINAINRISSLQGIQSVRFPTGETASNFYKNSRKSTLWRDENNIRSILPQYFDAVRVAVSRDLTYSVICNNIGNIFNLLGKKALAKEWFLESIEFIPKGSGYLEPYDALHHLGIEGY